MKKVNLILGFMLITTGIVHGVDIMPEESFEGSFPPSGWVTYAIDEEVSFGADGDLWTQEDYSNPGPHSGSYFAWQSEGAGYDHSWLVTKGVDISSYTNQQLVYWEDVGDYSFRDNHNVKISTNYSGSGDPTSADWTTLRSAIVDGGWNQRTIDISGYSGTIYIAFQYTADNAGAEWAIDDVKITGGLVYAGDPTNPSPADGAVDVAISGTLTWDWGADSDTYDLLFGEAGNMSQVVTGGTVSGSSGSYSYSGSYATNYEWQVIVHNNNSNTTTYGPTWDFTTEEFNYSGGSGTSGDPYQIATTGDLIHLSNISDHWGAYFIQTADIAFNADETQVDWDGDGTLEHGTGGDDTYGFSPIGNSSTKFNNNGYDGNEKTISNLFINRPTTDYIGLFGRTSSCIIDNLGLIDVNITGNNGVGALSGYDYVSSNVTNCYSTGNVDGYDKVGGLIGENWAEIDNCYSTVDVIGDNENIGGLIGENYGTIDNCYSTANVDGDDNVGGLVGYNEGDVSQSYSTGAVTGNVDVGGLVGDNASATVSNSYSTGSITRNSGSSDTDIGGFCGELTSSTIEYCYSTGSVDYTDAENPSDKGFVGGDFESTYNSNFFDKTESNQSSATGATGKTTAEMQDYNTFTDETTTGLDNAWDFVTNPNDDAANNDYWDMDQEGTVNNGYPILSWQDGADVALPVTLASFTAEALNGAVHVSWVTESETENLAFRIYRDGEMIAELQGAGTTSEPQNYTYIDHYVIPGRTYTYVLADVDLQSKETKHPEAEVEVEVKAEGVTPDYNIGSAYPNPFNPQTVVPLNMAKDADVRAVLYDLSGRMIRELYNAPLSAGSHDLKIDGSNLSTGVYLLQIRMNDAVHVQKVALMK